MAVLRLRDSLRLTRVAFAGLLLVSSPALAQSWAGGDTTPDLRELVAVDATGEPGWPYGEEDVAGDGLGMFRQPIAALSSR
jgi:hypothetical protein